MRQAASPGLRAFRIDGQVAAITGGAQGIGLACAELFAEAGAAVVLLDCDTAALDEPLNEAFRAGTLSLGWDTVDEVIIFEARELTEDEDEADDDDDDEDGPDLFRVRVEAAEARRFVARALRVLAAGRPPCPLCGQPLDPQGHLCPRRNGHLLN